MGRTSLDRIEQNLAGFERERADNLWRMQMLDHRNARLDRLIRWEKVRADRARDRSKRYGGRADG